MAYTFIQKLLPEDKYSLKSPFRMVPEGVCIHNTDNNVSAAGEIKYMITREDEKKEVGFHIAVDDIEVIQVVPFDRNCWASGDGSNGNGNRKYIHIEICYSLPNKPEFDELKFDKAEKNAAHFTAVLLKKYGWDVSKVKKHQDFSPKDCPHLTMKKGWQRFLDMIQSELYRLNDAIVEPVYNSVFTVGLYEGKVVVIGDPHLFVRSARNSSSQEIAKLLKGVTVTVGSILYENDKPSGTALWGSVIVSGKQGFIHLGYVKPL